MFQKTTRNPTELQTSRIPSRRGSQKWRLPSDSSSHTESYSESSDDDAIGRKQRHSAPPRSKAQEYRRRYRRYLKKYRTLKAKYLKAKVQRDELASTLEKNQAADMKDIKQKLESNRRKVVSLAERVEQLQNELSASAVANDVLQEANDELVKKLDLATEENVKLRNKNKELMQKVEALLTSNRSLTTEVQGLRRETADLKYQVEHLKTLLTSTQDALILGQLVDCFLFYLAASVSKKSLQETKQWLVHAVRNPRQVTLRQLYQIVKNDNLQLKMLCEKLSTQDFPVTPENIEVTVDQCNTLFSSIKQKRLPISHPVFKLDLGNESKSPSERAYTAEDLSLVVENALETPDDTDVQFCRHMIKCLDEFRDRSTSSNCLFALP